MSNIPRDEQKRIIERARKIRRARIRQALKGRTPDLRASRILTRPVTIRTIKEF